MDKAVSWCLPLISQGMVNVFILSMEKFFALK